MFSFKRLAGLPAYGEPAIGFPRRDSFREGIVFEFRTSDGRTWAGNFEPGYWTGAFATGVYPELGESAVFVVANGQAFKVDVLARRLVGEVMPSVVWMGYFPPLDAMIVADDQEISAHTKTGLLWKTGRISWDGIADVSIEGNRLTGKAYDPLEDEWIPFSVDLLTGQAEGGSHAADWS